MNDLSDAELMRRLSAGDDTALNALIDRWSSRLVAFLLRMIGSRDTAIDLAQETFVKLYQARGSRTGASFSGYLFTIAANLARNHHRWQSRHPEISTDASKHRPSLDPGPDPRESAESLERTAAIEAAILALPSDLREALLLHVYEGLSHAEIAKASGCSAKAVENRIYRAPKADEGPLERITLSR